jgi:hypothetical protein
MAKLEDSPDQEAMVHGALAGLVERVVSARQAAECLLHKWPDRPDTDTALCARRACLEALQGHADAAAVRQACRIVAEEAGIVIGAARLPAKTTKQKR